MRCRPWTQAEIDQATQMRRAGHPASEIAEALGRGLNSVQTKLYAMRVLTPPDVRMEIRRRGIAKLKSRPDVVARRNKALSERYTPELRAAYRARAKAQGLAALGCASMSAEYKRASLAKAVAAAAKARTGWCPAHLRPAYDRLTGSSFNYTAAEARAVIEAEWVGQLRRALAHIAAVAKPLAAEQERHRRSFAGQMERVAAGARVVPALRMSRPVNADRSLVGNATGMIG